MVKNDLWIDHRLSIELDNCHEIEKLIKLHERKISNYQSKIKKVEEGFEGGLYTLEEARVRKQKNQAANRFDEILSTGKSKERLQNGTLAI